jgi:hypothetical protein
MGPEIEVLKNHAQPGADAVNLMPVFGDVFSAPVDCEHNLLITDKYLT